MCKYWTLGIGEMRFQSAGKMGKEILTEGTVATEAGSVCQYFTTPTEKADPLLRRWLN